MKMENFVSNISNFNLFSRKIFDFSLSTSIAILANEKINLEKMFFFTDTNIPENIKIQPTFNIHHLNTLVSWRHFQKLNLKQKVSA